MHLTLYTRGWRLFSWEMGWFGSAFDMIPLVCGQGGGRVLDVASEFLFGAFLAGSSAGCHMTCFRNAGSIGVDRIGVMRRGGRIPSL